MEWYLFDQNNSGGRYVAGPRNIIVLANSEEEAADRAPLGGAYYDGVAQGIDCPCCGDRWSRYPYKFETLRDLLAFIDVKFKELGDKDWSNWPGPYALIVPEHRSVKDVKVYYWPDLRKLLTERMLEAERADKECAHGR